MYQSRAPSASYCKSCGRSIVWITMTSGKKCPVDYDSLTNFSREPKDGQKPGTFVTRDGEAIKGFPCKDGELSGYTSHFATCPNAGAHRTHYYHCSPARRRG